MSDHDRVALDGPQVEPSVPEVSQEGSLGRVGPYTLVKWLGSGGMGRVFLGREVSGAGRLVAVKVIRPEFAGDAQFRKRFEREVAALARVQGPYLARLMGSGLDGDQVWMATEYIPAPSLSEAVKEHGPLDAAVAWRLTADLVQAIQAMARAGIVHRDLKPSNVLLAPDGARVIDFGVAQAADTSSITTTGQYVGTATYMSPEQTRGKPVTTASDVFSLGCTLAYAVAGRAPFGNGPAVEVMHRVAYEPPENDILAAVGAADPDLAMLITDCLAKEPEERPSPDALFATAIAHQMPGTGPGPGRDRAPVGPPEPEPPLAVADPASEPAAPSAGKHRVRLTGAAIVTAFAVAGGVVALQGRDDGQAPTGVAQGSGVGVSAAAPSGTPSDAHSAFAASGPKVGGTRRSGKGGSSAAGSKTSTSGQRAGIVNAAGASNRTTAAAAPPGQLIIGFASNRCIDVTGNTSADGTPLQIWDCGEAANQRWQFYPDGTLRSMGKCMDVAWGSTANGAAIQLANCSGNPAQQFRLNAASDLVNPQADKCVDVKDQATGIGAGLQLWDCAGTASQKWKTG
ncbi:serine/threonine protein kinase [Streptomyces hygroscopicus]|uniref:serine/threonine protein kinase n=1 Tax=Streptomyces hygroscopicus TaxID=1912 RepID=UPI00224025C0|nr:serine/threonine protein kinase [Streptomyces hygroscopicus]